MKRIISIILSITFIVSLFTACSSDSNNDSNSAQTADIKYTVDYHYSDYDNSSVRAYEKLCTAVINYQTEVSFNLAMLDKVNQLFYTSFPYYSLVSKMETSQNNNVVLSFANDEAEHKRIIEEFEEKISDIMEECQYGKISNDEYVLRLYKYISENFESDNSVNTTIDTAISNKGISSTVNGLFEYILNRSDIPAAHLISTDSTLLGKTVSLVSFKDGFYYFDVFAELQDNQGKALKYFAMSSKRAKLEEGKYVYTNQDAFDEVDDNSFDKLKSSVSYEISQNSTQVKLKENKTFTIDY